MTTIRVTEHAEQATAGIRAQVPMAEITRFFARAFSEVSAALSAQGARPAGPPFGKYYGMPGAVVDVEAGFPVASPIARSGDVIPGTLPAGRVVEATHVGPYETLERTYGDVQRHFAEAGLTPGAVMWESYLSDPQTEPDPATWRTQICWPVA